MTPELDVLVAVLVVAGLVATLAAVRNWRLPLWGILLIALGVRVLVAYLARPVTPLDVAMTFDVVGQEIVKGRDPTLYLDYHQWNFLPMMPYLFAGLGKIGLPWVDAVKIPAIGADVVSVYLIGVLAPAAVAASRRLVYALHPVALLGAAFHGQVEPLALMLLLVGMVCYRRHKDIAAGAVFGLAISAKTWPFLVVLPVIWRERRRWPAVLIPMVLVGVAFFLSSVLLLHSNPVDLARALTSYGSFAGFWGWAGALRVFGDSTIFGYDTWVSGPGTVLVLLSIVVAMTVFRNASMLRRAWTTPLATLAVSAALGPQYLMWPVPMLTAQGEKQFAYSAASTLYMLVFYLAFVDVDQYYAFITGLSFLVIATMAQLLWRAGHDELRQRRTESPDESEADRDGGTAPDLAIA